MATIKAYLCVMPYAVIALCMAAIFFYRSEATSAQAQAVITQTQLDSVTATNAQQQKTIIALTELAKEKDAIVSTLSDNVAAINKSVIDSNKAYTDLNASDPDAKTFSDRAIPDSIKRLHNVR